MTGWQRFCYGMGMGGGAIISTFAGFMLAYYTIALHVNPAAAGAVIGISRVFDGISDLVAGRIVDRTKSRFGKARPWLLRMLFPTMICLVAAFAVPEHISEAAKIAYMFIVYNLLSTICFTMTSVPFATMASLMTTNQYERGLNSIIGMSISSIVSLLINATALQLISALNGGETYAPYGWRVVSVLLAIAYGICVLLTFLFCREQTDSHAQERSARPVNILRTLKALITNKYWVEYVIALVSNTLGNAFITGVCLYYAQFVLGDELLYSPMAVALLLSMFVGVISTSLFIKRLGKRNTAIIGLSILAFGTILSGILPHNLTSSVITLVIRGFGAGFPSALGNAVLQDTLTYGKWRSGFDMVGVGNAACSFTNKVGSGVATALLGGILSLGGFDSNAAVQSASAVRTIQLSYSWFPLIFVLITLTCFIVYRLDKEYDSYAKDLSEGHYGPDAQVPED